MVRRVFLGETAKFYNRLRNPRRFAKDEDGGVFTLFVVLGFIVIIATTGIGVDLMNYERDRANLQSTLDRAVLAAADLDQKATPKVIVEAYLEKSGLQGKLTGDPVVVSGIGSKRVSATAQTDVPTHFMKFSGIPILTAHAASTAEESVGAVEISLVLDMSGSMGNPSAEAGKTKIEVLREAAKKFVTAMIEKENSDKISMSIIPYATQVNAGENILGKFTNVSSEHNYSHCVNFSYSQFSQADLDPTATLDRTAHFDRYRPTYRGYTKVWEDNKYPTCPTRAGSEITPVTDNIDTLHAQIDALTDQGNTSIDIGMKWGAALLDPKFRGIVSQLANQKIDPSAPDTIDGEPAPTVVPAKFSNRPMNYDSDVKKIIIVMTDGQNTSQYHLKSSYRSGNSDVWYNPDYNDGEGEYSVRMSSSPPKYYWTRQKVEKDHPYGDAVSEPGTAERLTYPELFSMVSLRWNAENNYSWWSYYNKRVKKWYTNAYYSLGSSSKDTRTENVCSAAKDEGVIIFGIAFEAPDHGFDTIQKCASATSYAYRVNDEGNLGDENQTLEEVFQSIASSIRKLRLTQ